MPLSWSSVAGLLLMIAALVALLARGSLLGEDPLTIAVQVLAVLLMVWARATFGKRSFHASAMPTEGGLVKSGPYGIIRHPIYAAALYFTWAGVLSHFGAFNAALGFCAIVGAGMRIFAEEELLVRRYPEYREYAGRTKRIIPFIYLLLFMVGKAILLTTRSASAPGL